GTAADRCVRGSRCKQFNRAYICRGDRFQTRARSIRNAWPIDSSGETALIKRRTESTAFVVPREARVRFVRRRRSAVICKRPKLRVHWARRCANEITASIRVSSGERGLHGRIVTDQIKAGGIYRCWKGR